MSRAKHEGLLDWIWLAAYHLRTPASYLCLNNDQTSAVTKSAFVHRALISLTISSGPKPKVVHAKHLFLIPGTYTDKLSSQMLVWPQRLHRQTAQNVCTQCTFQRLFELQKGMPIGQETSRYGNTCISYKSCCPRFCQLFDLQLEAYFGR